MKSFIYFVITSYTFPESFRSDTTVTQDKSIWHTAYEGKTPYSRMIIIIFL